MAVSYDPVHCSSARDASIESELGELSAEQTLGKGLRTAWARTVGLALPASHDEHALGQLRRRVHTLAADGEIALHRQRVATEAAAALYQRLESTEPGFGGEAVARRAELREDARALGVHDCLDASLNVGGPGGAVHNCHKERLNVDNEAMLP